MTHSLRSSVRRESETRPADDQLASSSELPVIAGRIRLLRERLGLTQEKLAARLGVAFPTVNRWENGRTQPSPLALRQIEALVEQANQPASGATDANLGNRGLE